MHKIQSYIEHQNAITRMNFLAEQDEVRQLSPKEAYELDELTEAIAAFDEQLTNFE